VGAAASAVGASVAATASVGAAASAVGASVAATASVGAAVGAATSAVGASVAAAASVGAAVGVAAGAQAAKTMLNITTANKTTVFLLILIFLSILKINQQSNFKLQQCLRQPYLFVSGRDDRFDNGANTPMTNYNIIPVFTLDLGSLSSQCPRLNCNTILIFLQVPKIVK
jgi:hypothetical protein